MAGTNIWRDVKGYEGKYQVSYEGNIRRLYKNGKTRLLQPYIKQNAKKILFVGLSRNGVKKEIAVHSLVAQAFLGKPGKEEVIFHKNGLLKDNWASNLEFINRKLLGKLTGGKSRSKPVAKINNIGDKVNFYPSARQAAKANHMSYQTIIDRCNGATKSPFAPDGYAYAWDDCLVSVNRTLAKIGDFKGMDKSTKISNL